jgi:hypothetical protein
MDFDLRPYDQAEKILGTIVILVISNITRQIRVTSANIANGELRNTMDFDLRPLAQIKVTLPPPPVCEWSYDQAEKIVGTIVILVISNITRQIRVTSANIANGELIIEGSFVVNPITSVQFPILIN